MQSRNNSNVRLYHSDRSSLKLLRLEIVDMVIISDTSRDFVCWSDVEQQRQAMLFRSLACSEPTSLRSIRM